MNTIRSFIVGAIFFSSSALAMEEREKPSLEQPRSQQQQNELDESLWQLLSDDDWSESDESTMQKAARLIEEGANVYSPVSIPLIEKEKTFMESAVNILIEEGNILPLIILMEAGADINSPLDEQGLTILFYLADFQDPSLLRSVWQSTDIDHLSRELTEWPRGPFDQVSDWDTIAKTKKINIASKELFRWLIQQGAALNIVNKNGMTPLHWAVSQFIKHPITRQSWGNVIKSLISNGADYRKIPRIRVLLERIYAPVPLMIELLFNDDEKVIRRIQHALEKKQLKSFQLATLYLTAVALGRSKILYAILKSSSDVRMPYSYLQDGLLVAAKTGNANIFTMLLPDLKTNSSAIKTLSKALMAAAAQGHRNIVGIIGENPHYVSLLERPAVYYAFVRAARLGHLGVLTDLYELILFNLLDLNKKEDKDYLAKVLQDALRNAIVQRRRDIVGFILDLDHRLGRIIDTNPTGRMLRNIIRIPSLEPQQREAYEELLSMLVERSMAPSIWPDILWPERSRLLPESTSLLRHLDPEIVTLILTFLYGRAKAPEKPS